MNFSIENRYCRGAGIERVIEFVASCCQSGAVGFFLLWTDVANKVCVCYFSAFRYVFLIYWEYCACALYAVFNWSGFSNTVGKETTEFICQAAGPRSAVRSFEKGTDGSCSSFFDWIVLEVGDVVGVWFLS